MKQRGKKGESCRNFATKPNGILVIANSAPTPLVSNKDTAQLQLTACGKRKIETVLRDNLGKLPEPYPFKIHVCPMTTGNMLERVPGIFDEFAKQERNVAGLDMEGVAIARVAKSHNMDWLIMKGVMDYADLDKNDIFKDFAAQASAECLIAFFKRNHRILQSPINLPKGRSIFKPRIHCLDSGDYRVIDGRGQELFLIARFNLDPQDNEEVMGQVADWKKLHTCAEKLLLFYGPFREQIIKCSAAFKSKNPGDYDTAREFAQSLLSSLPQQLKCSWDKFPDRASTTGKLNLVIKSLELIHSDNLRNAFGYHLSFLRQDDKAKEAFDLAHNLSDYIYQSLIMEALRMADQVLERYFSQR